MLYVFSGVVTHFGTSVIRRRSVTKIPIELDAKEAVVDGLTSTGDSTKRKYPSKSTAVAGRSFRQLMFKEALNPGPHGYLKSDMKLSISRVEATLKLEP